MHSRHHIRMGERAVSTSRTFCCRLEDCLRECRIIRVTESSLVEGFPGNTDEIFSLPIPALQRFKPHVEAWGWKTS
ncbi:unnamed protein product [Caenorhabditis brenneri]